MHRCTGVCCQGFTITPTRAELTRRVGVEAMRGYADIEAAKLLSLMRPDYVREEDGKQFVRCVALVADGCGLPREDRPVMCNAHPRSGEACWACGAMSDAEARGVALMATPTRQALEW